MATSNKIYGEGSSLHEIKNEYFLDDTRVFKLNGSMLLGLVEHKTNIRFKIMDDSEKYINAIDIDYDSGDVTFTGHVYKLNTPHFKVVKQSVYAKGSNYMQEIVECFGQDYYIPTSGMCFIKCIN